MFKIGSLRDIANNDILLQIEPSNIPTKTRGDECAVNVKDARLLNDTYGINAPLAKCSSHIVSGTIRRRFISVSSSQERLKIYTVI